MLILFVVFLVICDPCHNFDSLWKRESALFCLRGVPFSKYENTFTSILEKLLVNDGVPYMDLYCYRKHMAAGTGPPMNLKVDFYEEFEALKPQAFDSWFDAQMALADIFMKNRDAHTFWKVDDFFGLAAKFFHPISIHSYLNGTNKQVFQVRHNSLTRSWFKEYNRTYGVDIDFESLNGQTIISIDGNEPSQTFHTFCKNNFAFSRDDGTCLNELLRNYEKAVTETWTVRFPQLNGYPKGPVSYVFEDPGTKARTNLSIDFLSCFFEGSISPNCLNISSLALLETLITPPIDSELIDELVNVDYLEESQSVKALRNYFDPKKTTKRSLVDERHEKTRNYHQENFDKLLTDKNVGEDLNNLTLICSLPTVYNAYYFNDQPNVVILQVLSMAYTNDTEYSYFVCFQTIQQLRESKQVTKILVDLRDNGGGVIVWGMELAIGLMKVSMPSWLDMVPPLIITKTYRVYDPDNPGTLYYPEHKDAKFKEADGSVTNYPPYGRLDYDEYVPYIPYDPIKNATGFTGFEPEDILIVTDGSCGSTCGMFTKLVMAMRGARVLVYGGFVDEVMDVSSFDGASNQNIVFDGHMFGYSWAGMFPFSYDASYDRSRTDLSKFQGFEVTEPDFRVYDWEGLQRASPHLVWEAVQDYMDVCVDEWSVKIDAVCGEGEIEGGIYGRPCKNGVFNMSAKCVIKRCQPEFYLIKDESGRPIKCQGIHDAPMWRIFDKEQMKDNHDHHHEDNNKKSKNFMEWWGWTLIGLASLCLVMLFCCAFCCTCCGCLFCCVVTCAGLVTYQRSGSRKFKKSEYNEVGKEMGEMT